MSEAQRLIIKSSLVKAVTVELSDAVSVFWPAKPVHVTSICYQVVHAEKETQHEKNGRKGRAKSQQPAMAETFSSTNRK